MSEIKSSSPQKTSLPEVERFINLVVTCSGMLLAFVIFGMLFLIISLGIDAPKQERIRALREETCAKNGMVLLQDKYHAAVCAFEVDEDGKRIP